MTIIFLNFYYLTSEVDFSMLDMFMAMSKCAVFQLLVSPETFSHMFAQMSHNFQRYETQDSSKFESFSRKQCSGLVFFCQDLLN